MNFRGFKLLLALLIAPLASVVSAQTNLPADLAAYLPLTDDLLDHSPAHHKVVVAGKTALRDGGAYFGGHGDWLELPHIPFDDRPFAVSMWIKITGDLPVYGLVEQKDKNEHNAYLHLMLRQQLQPWLGFFINDVVSPVSMSKEWTHLVFQYTGGRQQIWINGRLICERTTEAYAGKAGATYIGKTPRWSNVTSEDFQGYLRDFRIYNRALSFGEIAWLSTMSQPAVPKQLLQSSHATALSPCNSELIGLPQVSVPFLSIDGRAITIHGQPGEIYQVEVTANLNNWTSVGRLTNEAGAISFVDADAANFPQRFYRVCIQK